MNSDTTKASITPIDVRCRQPDCTCERSVPGIIVIEGYAVAPEAGTHSTACQHAWSSHESIQSPVLDRSRRRAPGSRGPTG